MVGFPSQTWISSHRHPGWCRRPRPTACATWATGCPSRCFHPSSPAPWWRALEALDPMWRWIPWKNLGNIGEFLWKKWENLWKIDIRYGKWRKTIDFNPKFGFEWIRPFWWRNNFSYRRSHYSAPLSSVQTPVGVQGSIRVPLGFHDVPWSSWISIGNRQLVD